MMKEFSILVSPIDFISFKSITISREVNQHTRATVIGCIADDMAEQYMAMLLRELWVTVEAVGEPGNRELLLEGVVTDFSIDHGSHHKELSLTIHSGSYLMDTAQHFRTFQNADLSYDGVMGILDEGYADAGHIGKELAGNPIGDFLMQYEETDWEFVKRLASRLNYCVCPADKFTGTRYYFGLKERDQIQFPENMKFSLHKSIGEYMIKEGSKEIHLNKNDCQEFVVSSREAYHVGDWAYMLGARVIIYKIESRYEHDELMHHCYMRTAAGLATLNAYNQKLSGCSFEATVREAKEDLVQIDVHGDENAKQEITKWFKYSTVYSTPDGTGWYAMPEIGDVVRLYIPSKREHDGYVASSVHLDVSSGDRKNPAHKSIMNKHRKEILFTPDKLTLTNNNGIKIEIADGAGVSIISNKAIRISAKDSVTISSENASMVVAGTDAVLIQQSGASILLDDDISFDGGEFRIQ